MAASRLSLCRCAVPHASLFSQHLWRPPHPAGISGGLPVSCPHICCPPGISGCLPFSCPPPSRSAPAVSPLPACSVARRTGDWAGISPGTHTTLSSQAQTPGKPQMLLEATPPPRSWKPYPLAWPWACGCTPTAEAAHRGRGLACCHCPAAARVSQACGAPGCPSSCITCPLLRPGEDSQHGG